MRKIFLLMLSTLACLYMVACIGEVDLGTTYASITKEETDNSMNSSTISEVSLEDIQKEKDLIVRLLNENFEAFSQIMDFFESDQRRYVCHVDSGEIVMILYEKSTPGYEVVGLSNVDVGEQITYIIDALGFMSITADKDYIIFKRTSGSHPHGGAYTQGLFCNRIDAGEDKIREQDHFTGEHVPLRDRWFYYIRRNNT